MSTPRIVKMGRKPEIITLTLTRKGWESNTGITYRSLNQAARCLAYIVDTRYQETIA